MAEVTAKPVTAPISIIPSTPRLRTPDFSTTSSPSAARSSGVAAPTTVITTEIHMPLHHAASCPAASRSR